MSSQQTDTSTVSSAFRSRHSTDEAADLIQQVGAVDAGAEAFTGLHAQHGLQVIADTLGSSCSQRQDWHIWKLLLQHS